MWCEVEGRVSGDEARDVADDIVLPHWPAVRPAHEPGAQPTMRVLLADAHRAFVEALAMSLERAPGFQVVGAVVDPGEARSIVSRHPVDVAVLSVHSGESTFLREAPKLAEMRPDIKLVGVADTDDVPLLARAVRAGFRGWVPKNVGFSALLDVLDGVSRGETCIPPLLLTRLLPYLLDEEEAKKKAAEPISLLTAREQQVLEAMTSGASPQEIAARLAISANTVRTHMQHILTKFDVHSSLAAVTLARRAGVG